jgi:hypothetical protein
LAAFASTSWWNPPFSPSPFSPYKLQLGKILSRNFGFLVAERRNRVNQQRILLEVAEMECENRSHSRLLW